ncbi:hypothetical protein KY345_02890 [Candidatus Woesearchaeota archaeon]|nr:hypothetical protein [Candidatus Woesearchaeota archaeon]
MINKKVKTIVTAVALANLCNCGYSMYVEFLPRLNEVKNEDYQGPTVVVGKPTRDHMLTDEKFEYDIDSDGITDFSLCNHRSGKRRFTDIEKYNEDGSITCLGVYRIKNTGEIGRLLIPWYAMPLHENIGARKKFRDNSESLVCALRQYVYSSKRVSRRTR